MKLNESTYGNGNHSVKGLFLLSIMSSLLIFILLSSCQGLDTLELTKSIETVVLAASEEFNIIIIDVGKDKDLKEGDEIYIYLDKKPMAKGVIDNVSDKCSFCHLRLLYGRRYPRVGDKVLVTFVPSPPGVVKGEKFLSEPVEPSPFKLRVCGTVARERELIAEILDPVKRRGITKTEGGRIFLVGENFVFINLGKQNDVKEGDLFYVYCENYLLGKIIIYDVHDDFSAGSITDDSIYSFEIGNEVTTMRKKDEKTISKDIEKKFRKRDIESKSEPLKPERFIGNLESKVIAASEEWDIIIIDAGEDKRLKRGHKLYIYEGKKLVAEVIVDKVSENISCCMVMKSYAGRYPKEGDRVSSNPSESEEIDTKTR